MWSRTRRAIVNCRPDCTAAIEQMRISQEIVLGIGGVRALARVGPESHGLAHERRARRLPAARAHPRVGAE